MGESFTPGPGSYLTGSILTPAALVVFFSGLSCKSTPSSACTIISLMVQISDLSFAAWQFQLHETVTSTMVAAVLFRAIVVGDYFWYEHW